MTHNRTLERALAAFVRRRAAHVPAPEHIEAMSAPAFRLLVAERLRTLDRDLAEVRSRINGLLFVVIGAVITQVVLRVV